MTDTVVVLGATGGIGREIVTRLLESGYRVAAVARNVERLQALAKRVNAHDRLTLLPRSVANESDANQLVRELRELPGKITAVVASLRGPFESGRLLDRSASELLRVLDQDVVTHFVAAKSLLPLLAESRSEGLYLLLGGPMSSCAWAGYGQVSIAAAALQMLTQVLREEAKDLPVTVQQLQIGTPVRSETNTGCACPEWTSAEDVARRIVSLIKQRDTSAPIVQLGSYGGARRPVRALNSRSTP